MKDLVIKDITETLLPCDERVCVRRSPCKGLNGHVRARLDSVGSEQECPGPHPALPLPDQSRSLMPPTEGWAAHSGGDTSSAP